jgi:hypothetical protein
MENLNDLIWTDEDDNGGCDAQSIEGPPMDKLCIHGFCGSDSVGSHPSCTCYNPPDRFVACLPNP